MFGSRAQRIAPGLKIGDGQQCCESRVGFAQQAFRFDLVGADALELFGE
jgi:hypothetical protein